MQEKIVKFITRPWVGSIVKVYSKNYSIKNSYGKVIGFDVRMNIIDAPIGEKSDKWLRKREIVVLEPCHNPEKIDFYFDDTKIAFKQ